MPDKLGPPTTIAASGRSASIVFLSRAEMFMRPSDGASRGRPVSQKQRSTEFAQKHFQSCEAHSVQAAAVHGSLEFLCRTRLGEVSPDTTVSEVLGDRAESMRRWFESGRKPSDAASLLITLQLTPAPREASSIPINADTWTGIIFRQLMGPFAKRTTWTADTIWTRSVRGVINERVRWSGHCTCGERSAAEHPLAGCD